MKRCLSLASGEEMSVASPAGPPLKKYFPTCNEPEAKLGFACRCAQSYLHPPLTLGEPRDSLEPACMILGHLSLQDAHEDTAHKRSIT